MTQTDPFEHARGRLGFGCMRLPRLEDGEIDIPQFSQMVDAFLAAGFNYFDTAHVYLEGKSEPAIRQALTSRHARDEYFLVDKLTNGNFNSTKEIVPLLEEELAACGVKYFDLLLMHAQSRESYAKYQRLGAYEEAYKLVRDGRVRHFGISFHDTAEVLDQILTEHPEVECVQLQLNYLDWDDVSVQSRACYEVCRAHGKPVMVMEPIKGGTLATLPPAAAEALAQTCPDAPASYALRFAGSHEGVAMVLSGMGTTEQMAQNIKTFSPLEPLSEEELAGLARVVDVMHGQDVVACTAWAAPGASTSRRCLPASTPSGPTATAARPSTTTTSTPRAAAGRATASAAASASAPVPSTCPFESFCRTSRRSSRPRPSSWREGRGAILADSRCPGASFRRHKGAVPSDHAERSAPCAWPRCRRALTALTTSLPTTRTSSSRPSRRWPGGPNRGRAFYLQFFSACTNLSLPDTPSRKRGRICAAWAPPAGANGAVCRFPRRLCPLRAAV